MLVSIMVSGRVISMTFTVVSRPQTLPAGSIPALTKLVAADTSVPKREIVVPVHTKVSSVAVLGRSSARLMS